MAYEFYQTMMGKQFYEGTLHELKKLNKNLEALLAEKVQDVIPANYVSEYLGKGWTFVSSFQDGPQTFVVVEKRKEEK